MAETRFGQIYSMLKSRIQQGTYAAGDYLPSEHELCNIYKITRTTVRKDLDELLKEGFIEKKHGRGSRVKEGRQTLGLLTVKGFSEAVGENVSMDTLQKPQLVEWPGNLPFPPGKLELETDCIYFERLRCVGHTPLMLERNCFSAKSLTDFLETDFVDGSFFKTLSSKYFIEITGSEQELRATSATTQIASTLKVQVRSPILQISVKFSTSESHLKIYSYLYCNTSKYPVGNIYALISNNE